jgi:hypothetical protein
MPQFKKLTNKTLAITFIRILQLSSEDRAVIAEKFNEVLDELLDEDFFGTEGQCDPRGDHRN